jgi:hypothetical protein
VPTTGPSPRSRMRKRSQPEPGAAACPTPHDALPPPQPRSPRPTIASRKLFRLPPRPTIATSLCVVPPPVRRPRPQHRPAPASRACSWLAPPPPPPRSPPLDLTRGSADMAVGEHLQRLTPQVRSNPPRHSLLTPSRSSSPPPPHLCSPRASTSHSSALHHLGASVPASSDGGRACQLLGFLFPAFSLVHPGFLLIFP